MGHEEHHAKAPPTVRLGVLSVSSTRTLENDESGHWIAEQASCAGHTVLVHQVAPDDAGAIRRVLLQWLADPAPDAIVVTGGTGISRKDVTIEAVKPMLAKELTAFGPLFAQLSHAEIGSSALLSRATAGVIGKALIFCLPGSLKACQLACQRLIFPELGHLRMHTRES